MHETSEVIRHLYDATKKVTHAVWVANHAMESPERLDLLQDLERSRESMTEAWKSIGKAGQQLIDEDFALRIPMFTWQNMSDSPFRIGMEFVMMTRRRIHLGLLVKAVRVAQERDAPDYDEVHKAYKTALHNVGWIRGGFPQTLPENVLRVCAEHGRLKDWKHLDLLEVEKLTNAIEYQFVAINAANRKAEKTHEPLGGSASPGILEEPGRWANGIARLQAVQERVRTLDRRYDWFGEAVREATRAFPELKQRYREAKRSNHTARVQLAREVLATGKLRDVRVTDHTLCEGYFVRGVCTQATAESLRAFEYSELSAEIERACAAVLLEALDREQELQGPATTKVRVFEIIDDNRAKLEAGTHELFDFMVRVRQPDGWSEPVNPESLEPTDLSKLPDTEYRVVALYHLGGLADVGSLRPIVPKPPETTDLAQLISTTSAEEERLPIEPTATGPDASIPSPRRLPPEIAEQMLEDVLKWVRTKNKMRNESKGSVLRGGADESAGPALTANQSWVLKTMAIFDASRLLSTKLIVEEMDPKVRLSEETVRQCVGKLIESNLAERPEGDRSGARLTPAGRRIAMKIAD